MPPSCGRKSLSPIARWSPWRKPATCCRCAWRRIRSSRRRGPGSTQLPVPGQVQSRAVNRLDLAQAALRRALAIDPNLACAHQFYTQLQMDLGESRAAAVRPAAAAHPRRRSGNARRPGSGVSLLRLLDESVAAHVRATALDPTIVTSVPHTHFLRCQHEATDTLGATTRYYLDAAAWTALGDTRRAVEVLKERLGQKLSTQMSGLMGSLLAVLEGRRDEALIAMRGLQIDREPEIRFYLSRHYAMLGATSDAIEMLQRARRRLHVLSDARPGRSLRADAGAGGLPAGTRAGESQRARGQTRRRPGRRRGIVSATEPGRR